MPGRNGGTLLVGPTNKGGPGRPPDAFKARMASLADRWAQAADAKKIVDDPDHPEWMAAGKFAAEQGYGRPAQTVELQGKGLFEIVVRREDRETPR